MDRWIKRSLDRWIVGLQDRWIGELLDCYIAGSLDPDEIGSYRGWGGGGSEDFIRE